MYITRQSISLIDSIRANKYLLLAYLFLLFPLIYFSSQLGINLKYFAVLIGFPLFFISLTSFRMSFLVFTAFIFLHISLLRMYIVTPYVYLLFLTFMFYEHEGDSSLFRTDLLKGFAIYLIAMFISLVNSSNIFLSLYLMLNYFAQILLTGLFGAYLTSHKDLFNSFKVFFLVNIVNGIFVILLSLLSVERPFGFIGVVFVDFAALSIVILLVLIIFAKLRVKVIYFALVLFLLTTIVITQTRSSLLVLGVTTLLLFGYLFLNAPQFNLKKSKVGILFFVSILFITGLIVVLLITNPEIFSRFQTLQETDISSIKFETDFTQNSFFSRLLIWSVSLRAFESHPIIGIGAFSFQFSSNEYSMLTNYLYRTFVEGLSPHVAYLAVLVETGVVGLIAFLSLWFFIFRLGLSTLKKSISLKSRQISLILLFIQVYIFISMGITDAWLWGQCGVVWGVSLGMLIANQRIVDREIQNS